MQRYACRRFLCVGQKSCVAPVMAECERFPVYIDTSIRTLKYWLKIVNMPDYRLVKKCYTMLKLFDSNGQINWVSHIRSLLRSNGYGYIWNNQCVHNKDLFILSFTQRLKDQYLQEWNNSLHEISRLNYYTLIKHSYCLNKCAEVLNINFF